MKNQVLLIHKEKHHIYNSLNGITKASPNAMGYLGMYDNSHLFKMILKLLKKEKQIEGYKLNDIDKYVKTTFFTKLLFLLSKKFPALQKVYSVYFEKNSLKFMKKFKYIHVVQDYTNRVLREAKKKNKVVIYEQIIADRSVQAEYLEKELNKWGYPLEILKDLIPDEKIEIEKENLMLADYIHVPSEFVKENVLKLIGIENKEKVVYFPYGVNTEKFTYKCKKFDGKRTLNLICVSRVNLLKGTKYLIEAMKYLKPFNVHLTFIGLCMNKEYELLVEELKELENVTYIESIPHTQMQRYYLEADLLILPSLIEGSSLVIYEALSSGLPCIVTPNSGSVINHNNEGFIINEKSSEDIVSSVKSILNNPNTLQRMSANSRKLANEYSWDRYAENMKELYNKILKEV